MRYIEDHDPITSGQNNGTPCVYCGSKSGHYGRCFTLRSVPSTPKPLTETLVDILIPSREDQERLHGLGVKW